MIESATQKCSVSVVIPTRNGSTTLPELLALLNQQTIVLDDIHVVDSASEDDTVSIARSYGAKVTSINRQDFDHGGTRSMMARKTKGDIIIYFTQDAIPASRDCVERLLQPFRDEKVAVCYGRQLPNFDADYGAARLRQFNYPETSQIRCFEDRKQYGLKTVFTSNSFAAYRRLPFKSVGYFKDNLIFGEDTEVVGRLVKDGFKVAYVADARVYHSHNYTYQEEFKRSFDTGVLHTKEGWLLETYGQAEKIGKKFVINELTSLLKNGRLQLFADCFVRNFCKYAGYAIGRKYAILPRSFIIRLSMHRSWWDQN